jgi:hypothetical protein
VVQFTRFYLSLIDLREKMGHKTYDGSCPNCHEQCFDRFLLEWGKTEGDTIWHDEGFLKENSEIVAVLNRVEFTGLCPFCQEKIQVFFITHYGEICDGVIQTVRVRDCIK